MLLGDVSLGKCVLAASPISMRAGNLPAPKAYLDSTNRSILDRPKSSSDSRLI